jgi:hypothetical protein
VDPKAVLLALENCESCTVGELGDTDSPNVDIDRHIDNSSAIRSMVDSHATLRVCEFRTVFYM